MSPQDSGQAQSGVTELLDCITSLADTVTTLRAPLNASSRRRYSVCLGVSLGPGSIGALN